MNKFYIVVKDHRGTWLPSTGYETRRQAEEAAGGFTSAEEVGVAEIVTRFERKGWVKHEVR